jgi:hypothetical protein
MNVYFIIKQFLKLFSRHVLGRVLPFGIKVPCFEKLRRVSKEHKALK